jgi:uncharacterized protein (DUF1330 family)
MTPHVKLATALIAGVVIGAVAMKGLNAQSGPPAYYIAELFEVTNPDDFKTYSARVAATVEKYGGRYLARGGKADALEGDPPKRIIVTAFKSMADARAWYNSPEYSVIRPIRQRSAKSRNFIVEGVADTGKTN